MRSILFCMCLSFNLFSQDGESENDTGITEVKQNIVETPYQVQTNDFHPVAIDTNGIGTVSISTYPGDVEIFLNGKYLGKGDQLLTNLKTGLYWVNARYGSDNKENYVLIQNSKVASINIPMGRETWFMIEPSADRFSYNSHSSYGPSLDLGIQYKNLYYGIDYCWNFEMSSDMFMLGGSAFKFRYNFDLVNILSISPGVMIGFWYADYDDYDYNYENETRLFFGGLGCKINIGYKWVFLKFEHSILIGNAVANLMKLGVVLKV